MKLSRENTQEEPQESEAMGLCRMPLEGRWEKEGEEWKSVGGKEVESEMIETQSREIIEASCRKRFQAERKLYKVPMTKYHTHKRLKEEVDLLSTEFSNIAVKYVIGKSVAERDLICLKITEEARKERPLLKPQVKYIANMHGDEVVGRELLLGLARSLCEQYGHDHTITHILQTVEIHILFSMNPDGYVLKTRNNTNDKDLNRGFPDWRHLGMNQLQLSDSREPEVAAVMKWMSSNSFILSLSFHDGWTMVIFPWDDSPACTARNNAVCSEDNTFYALALTYACNHRFMHTGHCPCHNELLPIGNYRDEEFEVVEGGMQDYNYIFSNCMELTVEVSCDKKPPAKTLVTQWENNYVSMLTMLQSVDGGVKGLVVDEEGTPLAGATVRIRGIDKEIVATERGEYWRLLVPGTYVLTAVSENKYGLLESDPTTLVIKNYLGDGATVLNLVAKMTFPWSFLLSSYKTGDKDSIEFAGRKLAQQIFSRLNIVNECIVKQEKHVSGSVTIFFIVFKIEVILNNQDVLPYFVERWSDKRIMRPASDLELKKLWRRLKIFSEETLCAENILNSGWSITLAES